MLLGNYQLTRLLERGPLSDVYLGQQQYLNTEATIKILHIHVQADLLETFLAQMRIFVGLKHAHLASLLEFGIQEHVPFLVLACKPSGTLRTHRERTGPWNLELACSYAYQIAFAVQLAHDHGLVHGHLRPEHLLVGYDHHLWVSDFALTSLARGENGTWIDEPEVCLPPEQQQGLLVPASDQYALAVLLYEWLCGHQPFEGSGDGLLTRQLAGPPAVFPSTIPHGLARVLAQALHPNPQQRYPNLRAFALALEETSGQQIGATLLNQAVQRAALPPARPASFITQPMPTEPTQLFISDVLPTHHAQPYWKRSAHGKNKPAQLPLSQRSRLQPQKRLLLLLLLFLVILGGLNLLVIHVAFPTHSVATSQGRLPSPGLSTPQVLYQHVLTSSPYLSDTFSDPQHSKWATRSFVGLGNCQFVSTGYEVQAVSLSNAVCLANAGEFTSVALQADFTYISGKDAGLVFDADANFTSYEDVTLDRTGTYLLLEAQGGIFRVAQHGSVIPSAHLSINNRLLVIIQGNACYFYLNNLFVAVFLIPRLSAGEVGLSAFASSTVRFTDARIWKL
jgi:serine/threonine protein kinase